MSGPPSSSWFRLEEGSAARDVALVLDQHFDEVWVAVMGAARRQLHLGPELESHSDEFLRARGELARIAVLACFRGEGAALERYLGERAARYAGAGVELAEWCEVTAALGDAVMPHVLAAYEGARLSAALALLGRFLLRTFAHLSQTYLATKQAALARSEHGLSTTLLSMADAVVAADGDGRVTRLNPAAERLIGTDSHRAVGRRYDEVALLIDHASGASLADFNARALGGETMVLDASTAIVAADGGRRTVVGTIAPIRQEDGAIHGTITVLHDTRNERRSGLELKLRRAELQRSLRVLAASEQQLRALAARVQDAREEERTRIAREIHDELGQQLTSLKMDIGWVLRRLDEPHRRNAVVERLHAMSDVIDSTVGTVRQLATDLRPRMLDDLGLTSAIEWQARDFEVRSGVHVTLEIPDEVDVGKEQATALFRVFQELLTNVARHAQATTIVARLRREDDEITLEVTDNGCGITADAAQGPRSLGLLGVRERATLLGGTFAIAREARGGTRAAITLPAKPKASP